MTHDTAAAPGPVTIRQIGADESWVARDLLSQRDGRTWSDAAVAWFLHDLDPERCLAWAAFDGNTPVGLTTTFVRTVTCDGGPSKLAYWANLYIDPKYRNQMLYPRLPLAMLHDLGTHGIEFLYASVRMPEIARAHLGIGFGFVGEMGVLARPLRPARFLFKYKGYARLASLAGPVDLFYRAVTALRVRRTPSGVRIVEHPVGEAPWQAMSELTAARDAGRIVQPWDADALSQRYRQTREDGSYHCVAAWRGHELRAIAVYRTAQRGDGIIVGVLMDIVGRADAGAETVALLHAVGTAVRRDGGELLIHLDGLGQPTRQVMLRHGFRRSPETYQLVVWPKKVLTDRPALDDIAEWAFAFRDHDAF